MIPRISSSSPYRTLLKSSLLLIIPILFFTVFIQNFEFQKTLTTLISLPSTIVTAAILLTVPIFFLYVLRTKFVYTAAGYSFSLRHCFYSIIGAFPYNTFLPARAGDLFRVYYFHKHVPKFTGLGVLLTERIFEIGFLVLLAIGYIWIQFSIYWWIIGIMAFTLCIYIGYKLRPLLPGTVQDKLQQLVDPLRSLWRTKRILTGVVCVTILSRLLSLFQIYIIVSVLASESHSYVTFVPLMSIAVLIGIIPVSISGIGTRDSAMIYLLHPWVTPENALSAGILFTLLNYWLPAFAGLSVFKKHKQISEKSL